jgi:folate-binding protein YgfZ
MVEATLSASSLERLEGGLLVHRMPAAVFTIAGPGALQCLQGLLTNDLLKPEDGSLVYGALLTPKGLIVLDCWVIKLSDRLVFIADLDARNIVTDIFRKQLPPRLAKVTDLTDEWQVYRAFGGGAPDVIARTRSTDVIARTRSVRSNPDASEWNPVTFVRSPAPFAALLAGPTDDVAHDLKALALEGARTAADDEWEAARILAGWARRGAEIDEKTLVQEVRFDENGGVSYEKGCYTGQETVARLHFRGHTNRDLRGLAWSAGAPLIDARIVSGEKEVGSVRSVLSLPTRRIALALIRREVETGQVVTAGGVPATVIDLPFDPKN